MPTQEKDQTSNKATKILREVAKTLTEAWSNMCWGDEMFSNTAKLTMKVRACEPGREAATCTGGEQRGRYRLKTGQAGRAGRGGGERNERVEGWR